MTPAFETMLAKVQTTSLNTLLLYLIVSGEKPSTYPYLSTVLDRLLQVPWSCGSTKQTGLTDESKANVGGWQTPIHWIPFKCNFGRNSLNLPTWFYLQTIISGKPIHIFKQRLSNWQTLTKIWVFSSGSSRVCSSFHIESSSIPLWNIWMGNHALTWVILKMTPCIKFKPKISRHIRLFKKCWELVLLSPQILHIACLTQENHSNFQNQTSQQPVSPV